MVSSQGHPTRVTGLLVLSLGMAAGRAYASPSLLYGGIYR